ncbi:hypothetical protein BX616_005458 [Lobosporangium transversale]|nr:hypothetical protein BX616_005458 [Lobosporangium transversale]
MLLHPIRSSGQCSQWSTSFRTSSRTAANRSLWQISPACRKAQKTSRFAFASSNETRMHFSKKLSSHNGNKDVKDSATTILRLDIKQRKSGTWLPKWQSLTITKDDSSDPDNDRLKAVAHRNQPPPNDDSIEGEGSIGITKYLLSPQATLAVFLPKGYPESVTPNYWAFAKWQFFHNIAGSVTAGKYLTT